MNNQSPPQEMISKYYSTNYQTRDQNFSPGNYLKKTALNSLASSAMDERGRKNEFSQTVDPSEPTLRDQYQQSSNTRSILRKYDKEVLGVKQDHSQYPDKAEMPFRERYREFIGKDYFYPGGTYSNKPGPQPSQERPVREHSANVGIQEDYGRSVIDVDPVYRPQPETRERKEQNVYYRENENAIPQQDHADQRDALEKEEALSKPKRIDVAKYIQEKQKKINYAIPLRSDPQYVYGNKSEYIDKYTTLDRSTSGQRLQSGNLATQEYEMNRVFKSTAPARQFASWEAIPDEFKQDHKKWHITRGKDGLFYVYDFVRWNHKIIYDNGKVMEDISNSAPEEMHRLRHSKLHSLNQGFSQYQEAVFNK